MFSFTDQFFVLYTGIDGRNRYESIKTVTKEPERQSGQLGGMLSLPSRPSSQQTDHCAASLEKTSSDPSGVSQERGDKTAENIRYGQNISETGMGGMTNSTGSAGPQDSTTDTQAQRSSQGYGAGNDVGG